jgi:hypothetical protein
MVERLHADMARHCGRPHCRNAFEPESAPFRRAVYFTSIE